MNKMKDDKMLSFIKLRHITSYTLKCMLFFFVDIDTQKNTVLPKQ